MSLSISSNLRPLIILTLALFIVPYDYVGIGLATPKLRADLGFSPQLMPWVLGGYVLTYGGFLILGGRLGDLYGRKRVLLIGMAIFGICSLLTVVATGPIFFLIARFIKGIGSALLSPNALAGMTVLFPEGRERNKSFGLSSVIGSLFSVFYLVVGGTILTYGGWRELLMMNIPLVLIFGYLVIRYVPESHGEHASSQFDFAGAILSIFSFGTLSFTVANSFRIGITSPMTIGLFLLAAVFFATLAWAEHRHPRPLVPLRLLKIRNLVGAYLVCFFWSASNTNYPLSLFLQDVLKYSPLQASLALLPTVLTSSLATYVAVKALNAYGSHKVLVVALVTEMLGVSVYATLHPGSGYWSQVLWGAIIAHSSFLIIWIAVRLIATSGVPNEDQGVASGVIFATQQLGNSFGIPTLSAVLNSAALAAGTHDLAARTYGFHWMFGTSIILVFIAFIFSVTVIRARVPVLRKEAAEPVFSPVKISPEPAG
jgi:MFS family permease